jgi:hypothetical protein
MRWVMIEKSIGNFIFFVKESVQKKKNLDHHSARGTWIERMEE